MKTRKLCLVVLSILTAMFLSLGAFFLLPKFDVARAEGATIVVEDNFLDATTENQYFEKENMFTNNDDKGDEKLGYLPVKEWGEYVQTTDGFMTYKLKADYGYSFDSLLIQANVGVGHEGGLYYYQTDLKNFEQYIWESDYNKKVLNFFIYVSNDNLNWTPALCNLDTDDINGAKIQEHKEENISTIEVNCDTSVIPSSNELYIKFYFEHPENSELPLSGFDFINNEQVGLMFESVKITATQDYLPETLSVSDDFNDLTEPKQFIENKDMISQANLGHPIFGFVPSTGIWDGTVSLPEEAYLTYKLQATKGCYITALDIDAYVTLAHAGIGEDWVKATIKLQASYNNIDYFDLYDLRADETAVDTWIDGVTYFGEKGQGCLNGMEYLQGQIASMENTPDSSSLLKLIRFTFV